MGGITNGSKVINSTGVRALGTLSRITNAVGTSSSIPIKMVNNAHHTEYKKLNKKL
jgi:hypothetical protein